MQPRGRQPSLGAMALLVVALSMAGGSSGLPAPETGPRPTRADSRDLPAPPTGTLAALPLQRPSDVVNAPTGYMGRTLHVNPGVGQRVRSIPVVREHGNVRVSYGRVADGVGAGELIDYLTAEAEGRGGNPLRPFRPIQTVRVVEGATPEMIDQTVRAVQLINASLPREWRLRFDESLVSRQFADSLGVVRCEDFVCETTKIPGGGHHRPIRGSGSLVEEGDRRRRTAPIGPSGIQLERQVSRRADSIVLGGPGMGGPCAGHRGGTRARSGARDSPRARTRPRRP